MSWRNAAELQSEAIVPYMDRTSVARRIQLGAVRLLQTKIAEGSLRTSQNYGTCSRTVRIAHVWGVDFSLVFICAQSVPEFLWDRLRASIQFPAMPKRAQYARFSGEHRDFHGVGPVYYS